MKLPRILLPLAAALLCHAASAIIVKVPSFTELVAEAEFIAKTEVTDVHCQWQDSPDGKVIVTVVTFKVEEVVKGSTPATFEFTQLGGQVGEDGMHIAGLPQWRVGERDYLFVAGNGKVVCPLVGITHGRYWIVKEGGIEYVAKADGAALADVAGVSAPVAEARPDSAGARGLRATASQPLTAAEFVGAVRAELARIEKASTAARGE